MGKRVPQHHQDPFAREPKPWRELEQFTKAEAVELLSVPSVRTLQNREVGRTRPVGVALGLIRNVLQG